MITVDEQIHQIWASYQKLKQSEIIGDDFPCVVGKYHTIFTSEKGRISMIELPDYFGDGQTYFEICSSGKFFSDCERHKTWESCIKRVKELLA